MDLAPRVPSQRDPVVDRGALATRAWFRFFQLLQSSIEDASLLQYTVVQNTTGSTIPKGTVVGFAGVGSNNVLSVAPYLADGSSPSLYILGIMAEDLPDSGATGLCCVWGNVSGIDTSAFSVGDILYASPTVAGALTNVKPTAPDNVIPMAAVLISSATAGDIFVRPTIEQQKYYGEFSRTTNLTTASTNTAYAIALDTTEIAEGVTLAGSPLTQLTVPQSGLYQFTVRYQLTSSNSSPKNARVWFRQNGTTDYANSTSIVSVDSNGGFATITASEFFSLQANDYVELMWAVSDTALSLTAAAATAYAPAAASVLVTVTQIQQ
jgi:hypothetical protein